MTANIILNLLYARIIDHLKYFKHSENNYKFFNNYNEK